MLGNCLSSEQPNHSEADHRAGVTCRLTETVVGGSAAVAGQLQTSIKATNWSSQCWEQSSKCGGRRRPCCAYQLQVPRRGPKTIYFNTLAEPHNP